MDPRQQLFGEPRYHVEELSCVSGMIFNYFTLALVNCAFHTHAQYCFLRSSALTDRYQSDRCVTQTHEKPSSSTAPANQMLGKAKR